VVVGKGRVMGWWNMQWVVECAVGGDVFENFEAAAAGPWSAQSLLASCVEGIEIIERRDMERIVTSGGSVLWGGTVIALLASADSLKVGI
jgi:hypothetical protein